MDDNSFTDLESAIVNWYISFYQDKALTEQLRGAHIVKRKWTEVGWYVDLHVPETAVPVVANELGYGKWPIEGPQIRSSSLPQDAGVILWGKQGLVNCIEMFAYGSGFPAELGQFELIKPASLKNRP